MPTPTETTQPLDAAGLLAARKKKQFNVMLSKAEYSRLEQLADKRGATKARIIRDALQIAYTMQIQHVPVCATGAPCPYPQVHLHAPQPNAIGQAPLSSAEPPPAA